MEKGNSTAIFAGSLGLTFFMVYFHVYMMYAHGTSNGLMDLHTTKNIARQVCACGCTKYDECCTMYSIFSI